MMHRILSASAIIALLCTAPLGAAEQGVTLPENVSRVFADYTDFPDTLLPALQAAKNKETADATAPQLRAALEKLYDLRVQLKTITELSDSQKAAVEEIYARRMREQWGKVYSEINRLQHAKCFYSGEYSELFRALQLMLNK